jgi:hypothetical protein
MHELIELNEETGPKPQRRDEHREDNSKWQMADGECCRREILPKLRDFNI